MGRSVPGARAAVRAGGGEGEEEGRRRGREGSATERGPSWGAPKGGAKRRGLVGRGPCPWPATHEAEGEIGYPWKPKVGVMSHKAHREPTQITVRAVEPGFGSGEQARHPRTIQNKRIKTLEN